MYMYIGHLSVCIQYVHVYRHMYVIVIAQGQGLRPSPKAYPKDKGGLHCHCCHMFKERRLSVAGTM